MKKNGSRMRILSVYDLSAKESIEALRHMRRYNLHVAENKLQDEVTIEPDEVMRRVYELVGGRTAYLSRVARASDMIGEAIILFALIEQTRRSEWCRWRRDGCFPSEPGAAKHSTLRERYMLTPGLASSPRWMTMLCEERKRASNARRSEARNGLVLRQVRTCRNTRLSRVRMLTDQGRTKVKHDDY